MTPAQRREISRFLAAFDFWSLIPHVAPGSGLAADIASSSASNEAQP